MEYIKFWLIAPLMLSIILINLYKLYRTIKAKKNHEANT